MSKTLRDMMQGVQKLSSEIQDSVPPIQRILIPNKQIEAVIEESKPSINDPINFKFQKVLQLDQIIQIKEKSFFLINQKINNIFKFIKNP